MKAHAHETARRHLARRVPTAAPYETAGVVRARLAGQRWDAVEVVCLVDAEGRLAGVVPLAPLLEADGEAVLASLAVPHAPHASPHAVAWIAA